MSSALVGRLEKHKDGGQHGSPALPNPNKYDEIEYLELFKERIRLNPLRSISVKSSTTNINELYKNESTRACLNFECFRSFFRKR